MPRSVKAALGGGTLLETGGLVNEHHDLKPRSLSRDWPVHWGSLPAGSSQLQEKLSVHGFACAGNWQSTPHPPSEHPVARHIRGEHGPDAATMFILPSILTRIAN